MPITVNILVDYEFLLNVPTCGEGHNIEKNWKNVCLELYKPSLK